MSLLIPTQQDYKDARAGYERLPQYKETLASKREARNSEGELTYKWDFEVLDGMFKQSSEDTDDLAFNYATHDFGITKPWADIVSEIDSLNQQDPKTQYKLLFLARHGQGYHNVIVMKYGSKEWHRKWHSLGVDGDVIYGPDPELTELGINQGKENNQVWKQQLAKGCPLPTKYIASPLQRSCNTLLLTMKDIFPPNHKVIIVEKVREIIGYHLCNKRSTATEILERFGQYGFELEPGFTENDELYTEEEEKFDEHCMRINGFLQDLFNEHPDQVINVTSHGGTIKCFLAVIGHRNFTISTGGMIPVVIKASRRE